MILIILVSSVSALQHLILVAVAAIRPKQAIMNATRPHKIARRHVAALSAVKEFVVPLVPVAQATILVGLAFLAHNILMQSTKCVQAVAPVILANTRHQVVLSASSLIIDSVVGVQLDTIVMVP